MQMRMEGDWFDHTSNCITPWQPSTKGKHNSHSYFRKCKTLVEYGVCGTSLWSDASVTLELELQWDAL